MTSEGDRCDSFLPSSGDDTVLSKVQIVHRLIDNLFDPFPVATSLYKLVNVLRKQMRFASRIKYHCISSPPVDMHRRNGLRHGRFAPGPLRLPQ